jgi:hypothetical protein
MLRHATGLHIAEGLCKGPEAGKILMSTKKEGEKERD